MLMRFDSFRELDRLAEQLASTASRAPRAFPMDAYRRGERFIVEFDLPGVEPASIELTVEQNVLTVRAERRFEPQEGDEVIVAERPQGTYARQVFLGDALDSERLQANCRHGVLTLTIPVAEAAKPRRVPVGGGQDAQTIEPLTAGGAGLAPPSGRSRPPETRCRAARAEPPIQLHLRYGGRQAERKAWRGGRTRAPGRPRFHAPHSRERVASRSRPNDAVCRIDDAVGVDAIQFASGYPKAGLTPRWCSKRPPTATVECAGGLRCCDA